MGGQRYVPATLPPEKTWYPLYRRLVGHQGRSGQVRIISPPTGIRSPYRPVVASHYTDWDIPAQPNLFITDKKNICAMRIQLSGVRR